MSGSPLEKAKRPASSWWALAMFCIVALISPLFWRAITYLYVGGHPVIALRIAMAVAAGIIGFSVMIVYGRKRLSYYVGSACLAFYSLLSVVSSVEYISQWSSTAHQVVSKAPRIELRVLTPIYSVLIVFLFYRFAFGKVSRRYYGMDERC